MIFKLRVFLLFAIFFSACPAFSIEDCDDSQMTWVQDALDDAVYLAGRAALTLQQVLGPSDGIPYHVQKILDAFLSPDAGKNQAIYQFILSKSNN